MSALSALLDLLGKGGATTQDEICAQLKKQGFSLTQSTISRYLRRVGAVKVLGEEGRTFYQLPVDGPRPVYSGKLSLQVKDVLFNESLIVIQTLPGSAPMIARHLDSLRGEHWLGTIAGDDTVFVAPRSARQIQKCLKEVEAVLEK